MLPIAFWFNLVLAGIVGWIIWYGEISPLVAFLWGIVWGVLLLTTVLKKEKR